MIAIIANGLKKLPTKKKCAQEMKGSSDRVETQETKCTSAMNASLRLAV
jgi:hypothetical protein